MPFFNFSVLTKEADSRAQIRQEAVFHTHQFWLEARARRHSRRKSNLGKKQNHADSLGMKLFEDILIGSQYDGQSRQEAKLADSFLPCDTMM